MAAAPHFSLPFSLIIVRLLPVLLPLQTSSGDGSQLVQIDISQDRPQQQGGGHCRLRVRIIVPPADSGQPAEAVIQKVGGRGRLRAAGWAGCQGKGVHVCGTTS